MTAAQLALDAFIGPLRRGERVWHVHTKRRGRVAGYSADGEKAAIAWDGSGYGSGDWRLHKYVKVSLLRRV